MEQLAEVQAVRDEVGTRGLSAVFRVAVPAAPLLEILWDTASFSRLFPDVLEARPVGGGGDVVDLAYRVRFLQGEASYVLRRTLDRSAGTIEWHELAGDFRRIRGAWRVAASDAATSRVTYCTFVDIGHLVPTWVVRELAKRKVQQMMQHVSSVARELYRPRRATRAEVPS